MPNEYKNWVYGVGTALLIILCVYFGAKAFHEINGKPDNVFNTISVTGHGETSAAPDIASISFTLRGEAKTVADAQAQVASAEAKALEVLKSNTVAEEDTKTTNASFNPKYDYVYSGVYRPGRSVITGYEAYETISVKIRKIDDAGKIIEELGKAGVSELSGPNFAIDKEDDLKAEARKQAIEEAKAKAEKLADDLGVSLGDVTSFSESGNGYYPMYDSSMMSMGGVESAKRAQLPKGENVISSDVNITYEIK